VSRKRRNGPLCGDLELDTHGISWHTFRKVIAQRCLDQVVVSPDAADLMGNHVADRTAANVVHQFQHPNAGDAAFARRREWTEHTRLCMSRTSRVRDRLTRIPKWSVGVRCALSRASAVSVHQMHQLCWPTPDRPMCSICFRFFRRPSAWRARCEGKPKVGPAVLPAARRHKHNMALFATAGRTSGLLAICLRCGCCSQHRVGKTMSGPLKRVLRGLHPTDKASYIQAPVKPWNRSNQQQRDSLEIPSHFVVAPSRPGVALPQEWRPLCRPGHMVKAIPHRDRLWGPRFRFSMRSGIWGPSRPGLGGLIRLAVVCATRCTDRF
jgi:hypothetical protein